MSNGKKLVHVPSGHLIIKYTVDIQVIYSNSPGLRWKSEFLDFLYLNILVRVKPDMKMSEAQLGVPQKSQRGLT